MRKQKIVKNKFEGNKIFLVLFLIILLGFSLRFYNLDKESLWIDEFEGSILPAKQSITYLLNPNINLPVNTYHIILHYWMQIFGQSELSVRFPALIFGVLSIFMIYKLGKILFNQEIGLLSALILAISPFQIHYSQEARPYSLLMLLSLVSAYYFIKFIRSNDKKNFHPKFNFLNHKNSNFIKNKKNIGIYIVSMLIGIYTHYFIFFFLIFQNIYFFIYNTKNKKLVKSWLISQGIIILIFSLYNPFFLKNIIWAINGGFTYLDQSFSLFSIIKIFYVFILDFAFMNSNYCVPCFHVNPFIIFLVGILFLSLTFLGIKSLFIYKKNFKELIYKNEKLIFLILYLLIPIVILYTVSFITPLFQIKYVIYSSAPLYILMSKGISGFKKRAKLSLIFLLLLFSFVLFGYYNDVTKEQWREASNFIDNSSKENDVIIYPFSTFIFDYYDVKIDKKRIYPSNYPYPKTSLEVFGEPLKPKDINQITSNYKRVWLVLPPTWEVKDYKDIIKEFKKLILRKEFKGVKTYLYELKSNEE